jgi:cytochrome c553
MSAMSRDLRAFQPHHPWAWIGWGSTAALLVLGIVLGFVVLSPEQQNEPALGPWSAICRALGLTADTAPAGAPQPPLRTPSRVAWTSATLAQIAGGNSEHGAFIAGSCTACHGEQGVSQSGQFPTLAGIDAGITYKQLDDFRAGKREWGAMNGIAQALSAQDSADVAAYFASRTGGLLPIKGESFRSGHTLRETNPAIRLAFAGDPLRGIPPCAACHGPAAAKLGAPPLARQHAAYIERQLAAFSQGSRQNDINQQMRVIAKQLTPDEMRAIAEFYGRGANEETAGR